MTASTRILTLTAVLLFALCMAGAADDIHWHPTWQAALEAAAETHRMVMLDLYTEWCHWCTELDKNTYRDPRVTERLAEFECSRVNPEEDSAAFERFKPDGYPTIVFLFPTGEIAHTVLGYVDPDQFLATLELVRERQELFEQAFDLRRKLLGDASGDQPPPLDQVDVAQQDVAGQVIELARIYILIDQPESAIAWLERVIAAGSEASRTDATLLLGTAQVRARMWATGAATLNEVIPSGQDSPYLWLGVFHLGYAQINQGDLEAAKECLEAVLNGDPEGPYAEPARSILSWLETRPD